MRRRPTVDWRSAPRRRWRRYLLAALVVAMLLGPSCAPGFDPPSKVNTLRILAVTADKPYALPGDEVTLRMTVYDGLGDPSGFPRDLQILWLAGCVDPEGDQYFLCFEQLGELLGGLSPGQPPPEELLELVKFEVAPGEMSGTPDALEFSFTLPDDIVSRRPVPSAGPHYGIAYVFFAACAGSIEPTEIESLGGEVPEFPLQCLDSGGNKLGSDSFVIGYTQVYSFAEEWTNANPEMGEITLDGEAMPEEPADAITVKRCDVSEEDRRQPACASDEPTDDCTKYTIKAAIGDVAEEIQDPSAVDLDGSKLREVMWVSYFADGGDLDPSLALVSDATKGYQSDFETEWIPPREPGLYSIWAVVRDQQGGSTVVRRFVRAE